MNHDQAARILRDLAHDDIEHDALNFIVDEIRFANNKADHLQRELDKLRRDYAQLVSDSMRAEQRRAVAAVRTVAEKQR